MAGGRTGRTGLPGVRGDSNGGTQEDGGKVVEIAAGGGAALAVIVLVVLLARGGSGRVGIVVAAMAGSALGIAATMWAVLVDLVGMLAHMAQSFGSALG